MPRIRARWVAPFCARGSGLRDKHTMKSEHASLLATAQKLGLPTGAISEQRSLAKEDIAKRLGQRPPYLAICHGLVCANGEGSDLLVEASFPQEICMGHYPGRPSIPLVDMGRAMAQAAAASLSRSAGIPLLKRISKLRAESREWRVQTAPIGYG